MGHFLLWLRVRRLPKLIAAHQKFPLKYPIGTIRATLSAAATEVASHTEPWADGLLETILTNTVLSRLGDTLESILSTVATKRGERSAGHLLVSAMLRAQRKEDRTPGVQLAGLLSSKAHTFSFESLRSGLLPQSSAEREKVAQLFVSALSHGSYRCCGVQTVVRIAEIMSELEGRETAINRLTSISAAWRDWRTAVAQSKPSSFLPEPRHLETKEMFLCRVVLGDKTALPAVLDDLRRSLGGSGEEETLRVALEHADNAFVQACITTDREWITQSACKILRERYWTPPSEALALWWLVANEDWVSVRDLLIRCDLRAELRRTIPSFTLDRYAWIGHFFDDAPSACAEALIRGLEERNLETRTHICVRRDIEDTDGIVRNVRLLLSKPGVLEDVSTGHLELLSKFRALALVSDCGPHFLGIEDMGDIVNAARDELTRRRNAGPKSQVP